ncbi:MAG: sporulation protein Cse60 [Erysipelotrichales bacterium]|nr:sporulation protein Cse60 [Erysipelotrichales bacterium]
MINVAVFDEENEEDLENNINGFLSQLPENSFIDLKFATSHFLTNEGEQIFSYSALIIYKIIQR